MTDKERLAEYVKEVREELVVKNVFSGEYCMLVLAGKSPKFTYKDLAHFESRVLNDLQTIDASHSVEFVCLIFED